MTELEVAALDAILTRLKNLEQINHELNEKVERLINKSVQVKPAIEKKLLTTEEVCEMTGFYRQQIYMFRDEGLLPCTRIRKSLMFQKEDVLIFLDWAKGLTLTSKENIKIAKLKKPFPKKRA